MPAHGLEAGRRIVGEPAFHLAVDGDGVVVIKRDETAELPGSGQGAGFLRHAFHEAAVAEEHPGIVIHDGEALAVELVGHHALGKGHAHGRGDALTEGTRGHFHAGSHAEFGMTGSLRAELAEIADIVHGKVVSGKMQQSIEQHGGMAVGKHEAVAIGPCGIGRIMLQKTAPEGFGHVGHAEGRAGMTGLRFLDGVDGKGAYGIGKFCTSRHKGCLLGGIAGKNQRAAAVKAARRSPKGG